MCKAYQEINNQYNHADTSMCPNARDFQTGNGRTPLELSS
jgi:hypothetical protein